MNNQNTAPIKRENPWVQQTSNAATSETPVKMSDRDWPSLQVHNDGTPAPQPNGPKPTAKVKPTVSDYLLFTHRTLPSRLVQKRSPAIEGPALPDRKTNG